MYKIKCSRCEAPIDHVCSVGGEHHTNKLISALIDLLLWKPEGGFPDAVVSAMRESDCYYGGNEKEAFFTQRCG